MKDNARCWGVKTAKPFVTIESREGLKGLQEKNRTVIPAKFEEIFQYGEYYVPEHEQIDNSLPTVSSLFTAVFGVLDPETGEYEKWDLLDHLEFESSFTDRFKRWESNYPYSTIAARYRLKDGLRNGADEDALNILFYRLFKSEMLLQYSKGFDKDFYSHLYSSDYRSQPDYIRKLSSILNVERFFPALVSNNIDDIAYDCISSALSCVLAFGERPTEDFLVKLRECLCAYLQKSDGEDYRIWTDLSRVDILSGHFNEAVLDARKAVALSAEGPAYAYLMEADILSGKKDVTNEEINRWSPSVVYVKNHIPAIYESLECQVTPTSIGALVLDDMARYVRYGLASEELLPELEQPFGGYRLNPSFSHIQAFGDNVLICSQNDQYDKKGIYYGVLIRKGTYSSRRYSKLVVPAEGDIAVYFLDGKRGYVNLNTGMEITDCIYDHAWLFSEDKAVVEMDGMLGFIGRDGRYILKPTIPCHYPKHFYEDLLFKNGILKYYDAVTGKCGLLGSDGKWIVPPKYHSIQIDNYCVRITPNEGDDPEVLDYGSISDIYDQVK